MSSRLSGPLTKDQQPRVHKASENQRKLAEVTPVREQTGTLDIMTGLERERKKVNLMRSFFSCTHVGVQDSVVTR